MKSLYTLLFLSAFGLSVAVAQTSSVHEIGQWRALADSMVSAGNRAYLESDRVALRSSVADLERWLHKGLRSGLCQESDSLAYTADLLKLRADCLYECASDSASSIMDAIGLFHRALQIYESHPELNQAHAATVLHEELAQLYFLKGEYEQALQEMDSVVCDFEQRIALGEIEKDDPIGPEPYDDYLKQLSALAMCQARCNHFGRSVANLEKAIREYSDKQSETYAELLRRLAKVQMLQYEQSPSEQLRQRALQLYRRCFMLQRQQAYSRLLQQNSGQRESSWLHLRPLVADAYRTENADASFLYDVTLSLKSLLLQLARWEKQGLHPAQMKSALQVGWADIQHKLQKGESAVEFITYESQGEQRMAALVLHAQGHPVWVPMPRPSEVTGYEFPTFHDTVEQRISSTSRRRKDGLYSDSTLRTLVWPDALCRELRGSQRVFFSPDAFQHRLAMEYMWPDQKHQVELYRLTSTRRLLDRKYQGMDVDSALICGAVDYDAVGQGHAFQQNDALAYSYYHDGRVQFPLLEHSTSEVEGVRELRHCMGDTLLSHAQASEERFRNLCSRYPLVFLSTHGDFNAAAVPQGTDLKPCLTDRSLSENVVAFAGVNPSLMEEGFDAHQHADGLLSALEMSQLDMRRVNLFIISACQTALGFITSDGVYGIQRGLKQAGVGAMLLSLWSVHDEATAQLMQAFHRALAEGHDAHEALAQAQAALRGKLPMQSTSEAQENSLMSGSATSRMRFNPSTMSQEPVADEQDVLYDTPQYTHAFILIDALPRLDMKRK